MELTQESHAAMVARLQKPGETILAEMTPAQAQLQHMAMGLAGEAGEVLDAIKKHTIYQKPIDRENVVEELGDLEFYMQGVRQMTGITRRECLLHNLAKLGKRYGEGTYSNTQAITRADKSNGDHA